MNKRGRSPHSPTYLIEEIFGIDERDAALWLADMSRVGGVLAAPWPMPPRPQEEARAGTRRPR